MPEGRRSLFILPGADCCRRKRLSFIKTRRLFVFMIISVFSFVKGIRNDKDKRWGVKLNGRGRKNQDLRFGVWSFED